MHNHRFPRVFVALSLLVTSYSVFVTNSSAQETLTITTYYPSPSGSYNELGVNKLAVDINGVAVPTEYDAMNNGDAHIGRSLIVGAGGGSGFAYDELIGPPDNRPGDGSVLIKGSVGIGTTTPAAKVEIQDSSDPRIRFRQSGSVNHWEAGITGGSGFVIRDTSNSRDVVTLDAGAGFAVKGTSRNTIINNPNASDNLYLVQTNGNVGIGTTEEPAAKLDISSDVSNSALRVRQNMTASVQTYAGVFSNRVMGSAPVAYIGSTGRWMGDFANVAFSTYDPMYGPFPSGYVGAALGLNENWRYNIQAAGFFYNDNIGLRDWSIYSVGKNYFSAPASSSPITAMSINVESFANAANADASYFIRTKDLLAAASFEPFYVKGNGRVGIGGDRTYLLGADGANIHWIMVGGAVEGVNNALAFNNASKTISAGPGWSWDGARFGGAYWWVETTGGCAQSNPQTGGCSCPAGFTATIVGAWGEEGNRGVICQK